MIINSIAFWFVEVVRTFDIYKSSLTRTALVESKKNGIQDIIMQSVKLITYRICFFNYPPSKYLSDYLSLANNFPLVLIGFV